MTNNSHNPAEVAKRVERRTQAMQMKAEGDTYQQIADALGYSNKGHAHKDIAKALNAVREEETLAAEELRALQSERLERLFQAIWPQATGQDVNKPGVNLRAADTILKIMERQARLHGLDAPVKTETSVSVNLDQRIQELMELVNSETQPQVIQGEIES